MAMGSCYSCIRYLMFAFNFLFWLIGAGVLGLGIWVRVDQNFAKYVDNTKHFGILYTGAYILIAVGVLIMIVSFLGCCGALRESQCMLGVFFSLLFITFVILLGAGIWSIIAKDEVRTMVKNALEDGVDGYFVERSAERHFMELVQTDFKCCGATKGPLDYPLKKLIHVEACQKYITPCHTQLNNFVKANLLAITGVALGVAVILILGMIFSMVLCCALRNAGID